MKHCKKCDTEKPKTEFSRHKGRKDGLQARCKSCARAYQVANAETIAERMSEYYRENKETFCEKQRAYSIDNADAVSAYKRKYRIENKVEIAEKMRAWCAENKEAIARRMREYSEANPDKVAAHKRNYRSRKRQAKGSHTAEDIKVIFDAQRGKCASCPKRLIESGKDRYHVDHIQPLSKGGSNDKYNLQCLCPSCNQRKYAKDPLDWAKENGRLL